MEALECVSKIPEAHFTGPQAAFLCCHPSICQGMLLNRIFPFIPVTERLGARLTGEFARGEVMA